MNICSLSVADTWRCPPQTGREPKEQHMNGVHDLGGTDGLGPVVVPEREPVFTAEWEKAAFAMFSMCFRAGFFGVDEFRYGIEQMHPAVYLLSPYYEHWVHTVEHYGQAKGLLDMDELDRRTQYYLEHPDASLPQRDDPDLVAFIEAVVPAGAPAGRESEKAPRFKVGDQVTVRADSPLGHTRRALHPRPHRPDRARARHLHLAGQRGQRRRGRAGARLHGEVHQRGTLG